MVVDNGHMATSALTAPDGKDRSESQLQRERRTQRTNSGKCYDLHLAIRMSTSKIRIWILDSND